MEFIGGKEFEHKNSMKAALVKQMKKYFLPLQTFPNLFLQLVATNIPTGDKSGHLPQNLTCHSQQYTKKEGKGKADVFADAIRHDFKSPCYTTRWSDIPEAT